MATKGRRYLVRLHRRFGGMCAWCGIETVIPPNAPTSRPAENWATRDHLRDRFNPARSEPIQRGEIRIVLACWKCNNERGIAGQSGQSIMELRRRAGRFPRRIAVPLVLA